MRTGRWAEYLPWALGGSQSWTSPPPSPASFQASSFWWQAQAAGLISAQEKGWGRGNLCWVGGSSRGTWWERKVCGSAERRARSPTTAAAGGADLGPAPPNQPDCNQPESRVHFAEQGQHCTLHNACQKSHTHSDNTNNQRGPWSRDAHSSLGQPHPPVPDDHSRNEGLHVEAQDPETPEGALVMSSEPGHVSPSISLFYY